MLNEPGPQRYDDGYVVRPMRPADSGAVRALFDAAFPKPRSEAEWRWRYDHVPGTEPFRLVFEKDGVVVGHNGWSRHRCWFEGTETLCALGGDAVVDPEHRGHHGHSRMSQYVQDRGLWSIKLSFPTDKVTWQRREEMPQYVMRLPMWVRWLTPGGVMISRPGTRPAVARAVVSMTAAVSSLTAILTRRASEVTELGALGDEVDRMAEESRAWARGIRIRDAAYLEWRWRGRPDRHFVVLAARRRGALQGLVVVGHDQVTSERDSAVVWRVVDLLARTPAASAALVTAAVRRAATAGADMVILDLHDPRPWSKWVLRASGMAARGEGVNVTTAHQDRVPDPDVRPQDWYLTIGDTDLI